MGKLVSGILSIQKFIFLLDDFHFRIFGNYLEESKALLPLKLAEAIRHKLPQFDSHEELCFKVYGSSGKAEKQNFNQLGSYTFRLSSVLARNYPNYLQHNISRIQKLVNEGKADEANFIAETLLDVAERIGDFESVIFVLKFLSHQAFLMGDSSVGLKWNKQLEAAIETERLFIKLESKLRSTLYTGPPTMDKAALDKLLAYYAEYESSENPSIRILSQHASLSTLYHYNPETFSQAAVKKRIEKLEKELKNYDYVVFPFLTDIKGDFYFLVLNSPYADPLSKASEKGVEELSRHYSSVHYLKNYLGGGQIFLLAIQTTRLMTAYHHQLHRGDYLKLISGKELRDTRKAVQLCDEFLMRQVNEKHYDYKIRSIKMMRAALLMFLGGENIRMAVEEFETQLVVYQQVNMKAATDSIYLCLMAGYFGLKKYERCALTYSRYLKIIKGKPVFEGNDLKIHCYYYISQWLVTRSNQYLVKLRTVLTNAKGGPSKTMLELIIYLQIPVKMEE